MALGLALIGALIIAFVAGTGGAYGAWMLWIAIPLLMISLGYFYLVYALPVFLGSSEDHQSGKEREGEHRKD